MIGNITLDLTDSAGRVMRLPLATNPTNSRIKPSEDNETVQCIPSQMIVPLAWYGLPPFRYLNVSKNDGPSDCFVIDPSNPDTTPQEQMAMLTSFLFTAEDKQSLAFIDSTSFGVFPEPTPDGLMLLPASGLSGNNITILDTTYDLYQTKLGIAGQQYEVIDLISETTTIQILPMTNAPPEEDGYIVMGGNGTDPLVFTSCTKAVLQPNTDGGGSNGSGDGDGSSGGGGGDGGGSSGGGEITPTMQHFFAGHPGYYFEDPNNEMLSFDDAKAKGLSRLPTWIETGMQQFTDSMDLSLVDNYKIEHTGYVEVVISSPNNPNHYIGSISGLTHEQLIKGAKRTPEVMYSSKKWRAEGGYYAVDTWAMSLSFEYRVTYTLKSSGEFVEALNMGNADYISIREKAVRI